MTIAEASRRLPRISVVVLNYNGRAWIEPCLNSVKAQTIAAQLELIVADNASNDGSDRQCAGWVCGWENARFIQNGGNVGFCAGNNRAAEGARGDWLFFLNHDAWLEADCLERLLDETERVLAQAAMPRVLDYGNDRFQSLGAAGFDLLGWVSTRRDHEDTREVFMPEGCGYLIRRDWFERLGGFDEVLFMYSDELDLTMRLWVAGGRAVAVPRARMHHRGAADVNPAGGGEVIEFRTSDTKRYYANRNGLLVVAKNTEWLWLWFVPAQFAALLMEALVGLILIRRAGFVGKAYVRAWCDAVRQWRHVMRERSKLARLRKRPDLWLLRFFRMRLNRWDEICRWKSQGKPKVSAR